jgi:hypothetical protein
MTGSLTVPNIELKDTHPYIDFHYNNSSDDYIARLISDNNN